MVLTGAQHLSLSRDRTIQSAPTSYLLNAVLNIIFPLTCRSSKFLRSFRFPHQSLRARLMSPIQVTTHRQTTNPSDCVILYFRCVKKVA